MAKAPTIGVPGIVGDALKYQGVPYVSGGGNPSGWDCSGFVNWVLGHDLGMVLPGGVRHFSGKTHGPVVINYASWTKARPVLSPEAGDLCIWPGIGNRGHIGIAISPNQMISALNPALGTIKSAIQGSGPSGVPLTYRRINGAGSLSPTTGCLPGAALIYRMMLLWNSK